MDLGAVSMMLYGWREREEVLRFFQKVTGLRMNHNYIRARRRGRRPARRLARRRAAPARADPAPPRRVRHPDDRPADLARAAPGRRRHHGAGGDGARRPPARSCAPPACRGTCAATCRTWPTTRSTSTSSSAPTATASTATRSGSTRSASRCKIVRQILDRMPSGDYRSPGQEGHAAAAGPHRRVDGGADPPLQDLHRGLQGARGRGLRGRREPARRARLLHRLRRLGQAVPHAHPRPELREPPEPRRT